MEQPTRTLRRLTKRSQFLRAARGNRAGRSAFGLQAAPADDPVPGIGFTVTKKTGNSPERNRIKRRLRAAVTACADDFRDHHDYVLVGRREALSEPFSKLVADLGASVGRVHNPRPSGERSTTPGRGPRNSRP
ncbi:ribonuclease P protein component [Devosia sp. RR2S18]|jgi:ribonuclease P protein component|uniref:ribonuclease P protein component n=1 Tax=Devosia rhizosphaerae TaxID=3049774 RepID=UPI00253FE913|nr:ribonuclease P protein component [Devosia sp. RR2S18]WIJ25756.1 ribonuclease P protein component [Devosia sp. RR2S18]HEV7291422.1 ribonuclease P protein component [Devosia sp.]